MCWKYANPHPKCKHVCDCVKRAITLATGEDYREVSRELNRIKRELGLDSYQHNDVWRTFVTRRGYVKESFPAVSGKCRVRGYQFAESHPDGVYILNMPKHLTCCYHGVILDTWDCSDKIVYQAYKVRE